ncbi:MAG: Ryanodine receptor Ryr [Thiohalocapsa sp.]|nr:Ryanodine receptor Ryr [Thiohalocapsa sp.]
MRRGPRRVERIYDGARLAAGRGRWAAVLLAGRLDVDAVAPALAVLRERRRPPRVLALGTALHPPPLPASDDTDAPPAASIDLERRAARMLLHRWPLHLGADPAFGQDIHVVIAGAGALARALLPQVLRVAHYSERPPTVTVLDEDAAVREHDFSRDYPQAHRFSRLRFRPPREAALSGEAPVTGVFVCDGDARKGTESALRLRDRIAEEQGASPPILLDIGNAVATGELADWDGQIIPVAWRRMVLSQQALLDDHDDDLARVIHAHYRDTTAAQGRDPSAEPAGRPWETLAEPYRDANRHQADHLLAKLAVTDCRAVPEELVESFAFAPTEIERLAIIEHARWAADRYLAGWRYAPQRDNARKHHPQLIPYDALSGPMKDLDRFAVRLVPALLARSGLGIVRMLIVAVRGPGPGEGRLRGLSDQVLARLRARYPDRGLIIASDLEDAASRAFARRALEHFGAGLFLLSTRPLQAQLAAQASADARMELLALAARAERRIDVDGVEGLARWMAARAEILVELGTAGRGGVPAGQPRKRVHVDPDRGADWNFEY